jgi:RimJ/RimL family protein N-acetyltransferase
MMAMQEAARGHVGLARLERSDGEALRRLFFRLSAKSVYRRFHSPIVRPEQAQPDRLLDLDHHDREAVVAVLDGEIVGVARYARWRESDAAELAVVVADTWQRQGLAIRMLSSLAELARSAGIERFTATIQGDNRPALGLLQRWLPSARPTFSYGLCEVILPIRSEDSFR